MDNIGKLCFRWSLGVLLVLLLLFVEEEEEMELLSSSEVVLPSLHWIACLLVFFFFRGVMNLGKTENLIISLFEFVVVSSRTKSFVLSTSSSCTIEVMMLGTSCEEEVESIMLLFCKPTTIRTAAKEKDLSKFLARNC